MHLHPSSTLLALRMWWPIVVLLAMLGAAAGVYSVGRAPYYATAYLRVDVSTNPLQSPQIISTALHIVDSDPVYFRATDNTRRAADELRSRTVVGVADGGAVLRITVTAPTAAQAAAETNRFADAAVEHAIALAQDQLQRTTEQAGLALRNGVVPDPESEKNRREQLGHNLADAQNAASRANDLVSRIGGVQDPQQLGLPAKMAAPLGAAIGGLLGGIICLVLGVRRRRIRRLADVKAVGPGIRTYDSTTMSSGLLRVAARCATLDQPLVAVLALSGVENGVGEVTAELKRQLRNERLRSVDIDADDFARASVIRRRDDERPRPSPAIPVRSSRAGLLDKADADVILVSGIAGTRAVREAGARADAVVLVGRYRTTRVGELSTVYPEVADSSAIVVLLPAGEAGNGIELDDVEPAEASAKPQGGPAPVAAAPRPAEVARADVAPQGADTPELQPAAGQVRAPYSVDVPVAVAAAVHPASVTIGANGNGSGHIGGQVEAHEPPTTEITKVPPAETGQDVSADAPAEEESRADSD
jgi:hypothetical protein